MYIFAKLLILKQLHMKNYTYLNVLFTENELKSAYDFYNISELVEEYFKDPNCWPALWISGDNDNFSTTQKAAFIHYVVIDSRFPKAKLILLHTDITP